MLFVFLGNLLGGLLLGARQSCLVLGLVTLLELVPLIAVGGSLLTASQTVLLVIMAMASLQGGYLASTFGPLILSRGAVPALASRRSH